MKKKNDVTYQDSRGIVFIRSVNVDCRQLSVRVHPYPVQNIFFMYICIVFQFIMWFSQKKCCQVPNGHILLCYT